MPHGGATRGMARRVCARYASLGQTASIWGKRTTSRAARGQMGRIWRRAAARCKKRGLNSQPSDLGLRKSSLHLFRKRSASSLPCSANGAFRSVNGLRLSPYRPSLTTERRNHRKSSPYATSLTKGGMKDREKRETSGEAAHRRTVHPSIRWRHEQRRRTWASRIVAPRRDRCTASSRAPLPIMACPNSEPPQDNAPAHNRTRRQ